MSDMEIAFTWHGVDYTVGIEAYDRRFIILPDGTVLEPGWLETIPPQLGRATEVPRMFAYGTAIHARKKGT